jgi:outer membrane protein assembly factor BamB
VALDRRLIGVLRRPAAGAALFALVATGCWPQPAAGPGNARNNGLETVLDSTNVAGLEELWSVPTLGRANEPVIDGGRVVVSGAASFDSGPLHVEAFSEATGARLWDRVLVESAEFPVINPVAFSRGALVTGYGFGGNLAPPPPVCPTGIERLDPATGATLAAVAGVRPLGPIVTSGDTAALVTDPVVGGCSRSGSRFEVRDRETLALRYSHAPAGGAISGPVPVFAGDLIVVADINLFHAFPAAGCGATTCAPVWTSSVPNVPPFVVTTIHNIAYADGVLFVQTNYVEGSNPPSLGNEVRAFDAATGAPLGVRDIRAHTGVVAVRDSVIYHTQQATLAGAPDTLHAVRYCRDCATRFTPLWSAQVDRITTAVAIGGDVVYLGGMAAGAPVVVALDADGCGATTCSPLATVPISGFASNLSVSGGRVFVTTGAGGDQFALSALGLP